MSQRWGTSDRPRGVSEYQAYQAKFRSDLAALSWQELPTFMGLTDQVSERVLITNTNDLPDVMNERSKDWRIGTPLQLVSRR